MSGDDIIAILPIVVIAAAAVVVMLVVPFARREAPLAALTALGFALGLLSLAPSAARAPRAVTPLFVVDGYGLYYSGLVLAAGLAVSLLSPGYLARRGLGGGAYGLLLLLASLGALVLVESSHFISFLIGLELLSVALFALVAYPAAHERPVEAGLKYLILAGVSSAFLLFGMALVYARFGTMAFGTIGSLLAADAALLGEPFLLIGVAMIIVGVGFKLSLVPFHMWAPDVFQGAPAPVGGFLASVSKGAVFVLLLRYFLVAGTHGSEPLALVLVVLAVASMLVGNVLALLQDNVKRILAYSSIAHLGYLLVAPIAGGALAAEAAGYYLATYFVSVLGAFGVVTLLSVDRTGDDLDALRDYRGLFWERPWLATALTLALLSLAGLPLTMGFVGKFYLVAAGMSGGAWVPVAALIVGSVIGLFYYLRVIVTMTARSPAVAPARRAPLRAPVAGAVLAALTVVLVGLGVAPEPLIAALRAAAGPL